MLLLRDIGRDANDVALQRGLRAPDCQRADLLRSRNVSVQKSRGQVADRHVVEAVTAFIGGQERCGVDVDGQQIPDRVLILGTIETPQRFRAAWIRLRGGGFVERRFQPRKQRPAIFHRGLRHVGRRHHARTKFTHDLLPDLSAFAWVGDIGFVQLQSGCLESLVVAGDAVAIEHPDGGSTRVIRHRLATMTGRFLLAEPVVVQTDVPGCPGTRSTRTRPHRWPLLSHSEKPWAPYVPSQA